MDAIIEIMREKDKTLVAHLPFNSIIPDTGDVFTIYVGQNKQLAETLKVKRREFIYSQDDKLHKIQIWCG
jgi:hypothetical protein